MEMRRRKDGKMNSRDKILQLIVDHMAEDWDFSVCNDKKASVRATYKACPSIEHTFILHDEEAFRRQIEKAQAQYTEENMVAEAGRLASAVGLPLEIAQRFVAQANKQVVRLRL